MKIAIVSRMNAPGGGASRIAEDLARGLLAEGCAVTHFCGQLLGSPQPFQTALFQEHWKSALVRKSHELTRSWGLAVSLPMENALLFERIFESYDVLHFHDHAATIPMGSIARLSDNKAVFFTAHDFLHLSGGCIYPLTCRAYETHCGHCPQRQSIGRFDFTRFNQSLNRQAAQRHSIRYVYPSDWLRRVAESSLRWKLPGITLPNGFDPAPYEFKSRKGARQQLGIDGKRPVICIAAHYLADPRKGVRFALAAVRSVADLCPLVILVGTPQESLEAQLPGIEFWFTGLVESRSRMGLMFAAADVFLFASLQDNLPIAIQESMAAATPVVGFATGGVPEMVEHGRNGWLVPTGDQVRLNAALRQALQSGEGTAMGLAAAERMRTRYAPRGFAQAHLEQYRQAATGAG